MRSVFIIEQDKEAFNVIHKQLISIGYTGTPIINALGPSEVLAYKESDVALIIANIDETANDGTGTATILRKNFHHVPILVTASESSIHAAVNAVKGPANGYLIKSHFNATILEATINAATEYCQKATPLVLSNIDYTCFFEESPCPMWILNNETLDFLDVNSAVIRLYGYSREEFSRMKLPQVRYGNKNLKKIFTERPQNTFFDAGINTHLKKNGEVFYVHVYSQAIKYENIDARLVFIIDVNAQILAEKKNTALNNEIKGQKERLEEILSSISDVVWSRNARDFNFSYVNSASVNTFGYTPEEIIGRGMLRIYPEDALKFQQEIERTKNTGKGKVEYRIFHKDGSIRWVSTSLVIKRDKNGAPESFNGVLTDITHLRHVEEELDKRGQQMESILNSISDCFFTLDNNWNFTYVNKEFERLYKYKREDVIGVNYWRLFPNAVNQKFYPEYHRAVAEQRERHFEEYSIVLEKWVVVSVYPSPEGITVYFLDISEEKKLKEKIIKDEYNLRSLINNTQDLIWSIDKDMRLISANGACQKAIFIQTGYTVQPGELILHKGFDTDSLQRWTQYYSRVLNGETFHVAEERDGAVNRHLDIYFAPMYDDTANIVGASCFVKDVTEQKNYLLRIQSQNERLREIAWIQSHKVRGPVASILGLIPLLDFSAPADPANAEILAWIQSAIETLDQTIREIDIKTGQL